ncbi:Cut9 interacting protein Scn1 [Aspergillus sp. HF37]|nr:Cut9 interacting protein Scn1 [Aspergillus sp. HF37]
MAQPAHDDADSFPWSLGVYDAHCHPTDSMASTAEIPQMKAAALTIMATRDEDQDLVTQTAQSLSRDRTGAGEDRVVPCFGWHPWFSHQITLDDNNNNTASRDTSDEDRKHSHYKAVLAPSPDDTAFTSALPPPIPLSQLISQTRTRLAAHPTALIGEIGLDRAFRLPNPWTTQELADRNATLTPGSREGRALSPFRVHMEHQKAVLRAHLRLAGELHRAVSVHSVQAHGAVFDLLKELWAGHERKRPSRKERLRRRSAELAHVDETESDSGVCESRPRRSPGSAGGRGKDQSVPARPPPLSFPPRICMHSYSGPVEPIKQFLHPGNPSDVYFSFSSVINFHGPSAQKAMDAVKSLPADRVLIESDLHTAGQQMDELLEEVVRTVCRLRGWSLHDGVRQLGDNWRRFVYGST